MKVKVHVDTSAIGKMVDNLIDSDTMLAIHQAFARRCNPYVPYKTGALANSGLEHVTSEGVTYTMPYAKKQYVGVDIPHNLMHHPKATALWDKVMMQEEGEAFTKEIQDILIRRAKELYG